MSGALAERERWRVGEGHPLASRWLVPEDKWRFKATGLGGPVSNHRISLSLLSFFLCSASSKHIFQTAYAVVSIRLSPGFTTPNPSRQECNFVLCTRRLPPGSP